MKHSPKSFRLDKIALVSTVLAGFLAFIGASQVRANDDVCQRTVARADHNLHEAIEHHGYFSKQANHWRHELAEARELCWESRHRWWDEDFHRWHTDRDWDDHDHDGHHDQH